jgi:hypothetical protein
MAQADWDEFVRSHPAAHLVAGIVPRTANAARLGRPGRLNLSAARLLGTVIAALRPRGAYALTHVPDGAVTRVLCAFAVEDDAHRLAELANARPETERYAGDWRSCRAFLFDRHRRDQLTEYLRGQEHE